jgi:hypothetical protein
MWSLLFCLLKLSFAFNATENLNTVLNTTRRNELSTSAFDFQFVAQYAGAACKQIIYLDCDQIFTNQTYQCGPSCSGDAIGTKFSEGSYDKYTTSAGYFQTNKDLFHIIQSLKLFL